MRKITARFFATMLAVLTLLGTLPALMSYADEPAVPTKTYDFEADTVGKMPAYFTASSYDATKTTIQVAEEGNGNKALYVNNTSGKPTVTMQFAPQNGTFTIGFRIKYMSTEESTQSTVSLTDGASQTFTLLEQKGVLKNHNGTAWVNLMDSYERNVWYTVNAVINVSNGTYDMTIRPDGGEAKAITNFPFRVGTVTEINTFSISLAGKTVAELYIDDIILPTDEEPPVDPEPDEPGPIDPEPENPEPENPDEPQDTTELQAAINKVASDLAAAQNALNTAIANGDKGLDTKITALNTALEAAKKAYADADTAMQSALNTKIEAADATLATAIKTVQKNLDDAIATLNAADKTNAAAIAKAISDLNTAIESAESAAATADVAISDELSGMIDAAEAALQTKLDALTTELQNVKKELEDKIKALENASGEPTVTDEATDPIVIASMVISCVSICGCVVLAALYTSNKKKKA